MTTLETLRRDFIDPPAEFSPIPFWFWNDELSKEELIRQIHDFRAKEVEGFVIHPRMGMPRTIPYLSDTYMELVEAAVAEAEKLGMRVILYDEGMYPSGSACGLVVKENPEYASRGLRMIEVPCSRERGKALWLPAGDARVSVQAVRKLPDGGIDEERTIVLGGDPDLESFSVPDDGEWSLLIFVETPSKGTVRGVHHGQDDGEPEAPLASDLLNPDAVQAFIRLTHDKYYARLGRYFGKTVFAMFTDEPDLLGRGHAQGLKPWTRGFLADFLAEGGKEADLPLLWLEGGERTRRAREVYETAVRNRMKRTYYGPLAAWCQAHGIGLTGHPASSEEIGLLEPFHIPGQDIVWRYIAPEDGKGLTGPHSTMGKCSSDSARHRGRRRNLNEAFGVCGIEGGWSLTADNMKWYLDWLFVRGVNLISPHAFYYSIRGERRDERPPDVGPNNIWWPEYARFSRYIKRMSWLMTDVRNGAEVAVLAGAAYLPWQIVKPLYERQIEFNYLEEDLLISSCECNDGALEMAGYRYRAVLIDGEREVAEESVVKLEAFVRQGGIVIEQARHAGYAVREIGQLRVSRAEEAADAIARHLGKQIILEPAAEFVRFSRVKREGVNFYVLVNEGESGYTGNLRIKQPGYAERWHPWTGEFEVARGESGAERYPVKIRLERRECLVIAVDPDRAPAEGREPEPTTASEEWLSTGWKVIDGPWLGELAALASWTEWEGLANYSGTVTYEKDVEMDDPSAWSEIRLDLGGAHEIVRLEINGREAGVRMWSPYAFDVGPLWRPGINVLRVSVTNSLANRYDGKSFPSGLIGPVRLFMR